MASATVANLRASAIETLVGSITSVGFSSGHQFVLGWWRESPIGSFADLMWAHADGRRILVASPRAADFVTSVYPFEEVCPTEVAVSADGRRIGVDAGDVQLRLELGRMIAPFPPRPRWVTQTVENTIAGWTLDVSSFGVSKTGVAEWYRSKTVRGIRRASVRVCGVDCGDLVALERPIGFGFTDPPKRPSHVALRVDLRRPEHL